jgi:hypothetical protein
VTSSKRIGVALVMVGRYSVSLRFRSMVTMPELVHVTGVEVVRDHRLRLVFEDGTEGEVDFSGCKWHGVFEPLADQAYFRQVELDRELGTIVWPNGADIAPETLYSWVTGQKVAVV